MVMKKTSNPLKTHLTLISISLGVFIIDQLFKFGITSFLSLGESFPENWPVRFTYVRNTGIAFGIPANQFFLVFMTSAVVAALLVYLIRYHESQPRLVRIALSSITGGAVGNLIDRVRLGYVVDFVDFQVWPVFNIADSSVVVGVGLLLYFLIFHPEARLQNKDRIDNNNV